MARFQLRQELRILPPHSHLAEEVLSRFLCYLPFSPHRVLDQRLAAHYMRLFLRLPFRGVPRRMVLVLQPVLVIDIC